MPTSNSIDPQMSFIVPVRNDAVALRRCLQSIAIAASDVRCEVIVADNGSTDNSRETAEALGARVLHVPDRSVAQVRNIGARVARGEFLAFVDADNELASAWVGEALEILKDASVAGVGAQYHPPRNAGWVTEVYDALRRHQPGTHNVDWLPSGNLVVRKAVFEALGGFDEALETCEDVDFSQRVRQTGGRLMAAAGLLNVHHGDPRTLSALFKGELWRGRDNLRVSLRYPLTLRSLPSIALPILTLGALAMIAVGVLVGPFLGWQAAAVGVAAFVGLAGACALGLLHRSAMRLRIGFVLPRVVAFATVYNTARALALISGATYDVRRKG
jgi:GT2 family glycosyltransferase